MMDLTDIAFPDDTRYAYAVGRIRALETRLLKRSDFARLLDVENYTQAIRLLAEMGYPASDEAAEHEPVLVAEQQKVLVLLEKLDQEGKLADLFRRRYDFHNLKALLKAKYSQQELPAAILELGSLPVEVMGQAVLADEAQRLPPSLAEALRAAEAAYSESRDPGDLDVAVERVQYADMAQALRSMDCPFLNAWLTWQADLLNIKSFLRLKWLQEDLKKFDGIILPGGSLEWRFFREIREEPLDGLVGIFQKTRYGQAVAEGISQLKMKKSFAPLERNCDDLVMELLRTSSQASFGVEPLVAYVLLKEFEIRAVRAILVGKLNGLPKERIKERLPSAYI